MIIVIFFLLLLAAKNVHACMHLSAWYYSKESSRGSQGGLQWGPEGKTQEGPQVVTVGGPQVKMQQEFLQCPVGVCFCRMTDKNFPLVSHRPYRLSNTSAFVEVDKM